MINSFETLGKSALFNHGPIIGTPTVRKSNFEILLKEFVYRTAFLIIHSSKFLYQTASVFSIYNSPSAYWLNFSKNARHLAADLFEAIGVVVFSILCLPFKHTNHNIFIKAQLFIENTAEKISGESDFIKKQINLFDIAENLASLDGEEKINWRAKKIALDNWIHTRRICRDRGQSILQSLKELEDQFHVKIEKAAIKKQEIVLNNLNTLIENLNLIYPIKEDFNKQSNSYFEDLTAAIEKKQSFIRKSIDPENKMEKSLDSFNLVLKNQFLELLKLHRIKSTKLKTFCHLLAQDLSHLQHLSHEQDLALTNFNFCYIEHFIECYESFFDQKALFRFESITNIDKQKYVEDFLEKNTQGVTLFESKKTSPLDSLSYSFLKDVYIMMLNLPPDTDSLAGKEAFENFDHSCCPPKTSSQIYYSTFEQIYKILKSREDATVDID